MTDSPPDRALVAAVLATGDERAFRLLYQRHTPRLYRMAVRLTGDRGGIAEDLVHDTWVRASAGLAGFAWRASLGTWLTGILINRAREQYREWAGEAGPPMTEPAADAPVPLDDRLDLQAAVAALPPGYREAIVLHDIEGYTHEDIAVITGRDVGTSKSQLSRARRLLRRWLVPERSPA